MADAIELPHALVADVANIRGAISPRNSSGFTALVQAQPSWPPAGGSSCIQTRRLVDKAISLDHRLLTRSRNPEQLLPIWQRGGNIPGRRQLSASRAGQPTPNPSPLAGPQRAARGIPRLGSSPRRRPPLSAIGRPIAASSPIDLTKYRHVRDGVVLGRPNETTGFHCACRRYNSDYRGSLDHT
jgi:hypothetical protein